MIRLIRLIAPVVVLMMACLSVTADTVWLVPEVYLFDTSGQATNLSFKAVHVFEVTGSGVAINSDGTPSAEFSHERYKPELHYGLSSGYLFSELSPPVSDLFRPADFFQAESSALKINAQFYNPKVYEEYLDTLLLRPLEFHPPDIDIPFFTLLQDALDFQGSVRGDLEFRIDTPGLAIFADTPDPLIPALFHSVPFDFVSGRNRPTEYPTGSFKKGPIWWNPVTWGRDRLMWLGALIAGAGAILALIRHWLQESEEDQPGSSKLLSQSMQRVVVKAPAGALGENASAFRRRFAILPKDESWRSLPPLQVPALSAASVNEHRASSDFRQASIVSPSFTAPEQVTAEAVLPEALVAETQTQQLPDPDSSDRTQDLILQSLSSVENNFAASQIAAPAHQIDEALITSGVCTKEVSELSPLPASEDSKPDGLRVTAPMKAFRKASSLNIASENGVSDIAPSKLARSFAPDNMDANEPPVHTKASSADTPFLSVNAPPVSAVSSTTLLSDEEFQEDEIITSFDLLFPPRSAASDHREFMIEKCDVEIGDEDELSLYNDGSPAINEASNGCNQTGFPDRMLWRAPEHNMSNAASIPESSSGSSGLQMKDYQNGVMPTVRNGEVSAPRAQSAAVGQSVLRTENLSRSAAAPLGSEPIISHTFCAEKRAEALVNWLENGHPEMMNDIPATTYEAEEFRGLPFAILNQDENILDLDDFDLPATPAGKF
jgi:hypothetical protein